MAIDALVAPLLRVELFQGLSPLQITEIARHAERIVFRPGDKITTAGAVADAALLIVGGAAEWLSGPAVDSTMPVPKEPIEIGSLIGELAMVIEHTYGSTIVATSQVRCLKLNRATMHTLMLEDQSLAEHLTTKITGRLSGVARALRDIDDAFVDGLPDFLLEPDALSDAVKTAALPALQPH